MQFIKNNVFISFDEFKADFPAEADILSECLSKDWIMQVEDNFIKFQYGKLKPIWINIYTIMDKHKRYFFKNSYYKEPLARALGLKKGKVKPTVLDATAGMLGDSLLMYNFELAALTCLERHPMVASLITNALNNHPLQGLAFKYLPAMEVDESFDVCFFDPMYAEKNTKTAPKKEMLVFRDIIGADNDAKDVAKHLLSLSRERLVVKRSSKAGVLLESPHHTIAGKSTCYDVYLKS